MCIYFSLYFFVTGYLPWFYLTKCIATCCATLYTGKQRTTVLIDLVDKSDRPGGLVQCADLPVRTGAAAGTPSYSISTLLVFKSIVQTFLQSLLYTYCTWSAADLVVLSIVLTFILVQPPLWTLFTSGPSCCSPVHRADHPAVTAVDLLHFLDLHLCRVLLLHLGGGILVILVLNLQLPLGPWSLLWTYFSAALVNW